MAAEFVLVTKSRFEQMKHMEKNMEETKPKKEEPESQKAEEVRPDPPSPAEELKNVNDNTHDSNLEIKDKNVNDNTHNSTSEKKDEKNTSQIQDEVEQLVTKYPHMGALFNMFSQNPETLKWNNNGSIVIDGDKTIYGSDIINLMKDTLNNKMHPVGKMAFYRAMAKLNVPSKLIVNAKNKQILAKLKKPPKLMRGDRKKTGPTSKTGWITW